MNISYKERQISFLPDPVADPDESRRPRFTAAQLTLGVENLVILTIVSIMVILFSFSLGVERGKGIALKDIGQPVSVDKTDLAKDASSEKTSSRPFWSMFGKKPADTAVSSEETSQGVSAAGAKGGEDSAVRVIAKTADKGTKASVQAAEAPVKTGTAFTIQIASYKTQKGAQTEASSLKKKGYSDVFVLQKGSYVILCVGNFQKREEASLLGKKLRGRYQDLRVRSL